ncbi:hypothetical protein LINPERHAP1_LOCUS25818 [Linum perenne]
MRIYLHLRPPCSVNCLPPSSDSIRRQEPKLVGLTVTGDSPSDLQYPELTQSNKSEDIATLEVSKAQRKSDEKPFTEEERSERDQAGSLESWTQAESLRLSWWWWRPAA